MKAVKVRSYIFAYVLFFNHFEGLLTVPPEKIQRKRKLGLLSGNPQGI